jgi:hypothetical protein
MIEIHYTKVIPYPFDVVLGQYFDYEHIEFVHPGTLGRYRVVETKGNVITYEHLWPKKALRSQRRSLVEHRFIPPNEMWFTFVEGHLKGVKTHTFIREHEQGCLIDETFLMPGLQNWSWLKPLIRPLVMRTVNRIWQEDLDVEVCYGGWPGVPEERV